MKKDIDCLLIGHNEIRFEEYEKITRKMGVNSGTYRDLNLNYIKYNDKPHTATGIFNLLNNMERKFKPVKFGETFSAAVAYMGSYLNRSGFTFDYVNSFQDEKTRLAEILVQNNISTVAILTTLYVFALPIIEIIDFIRKYNQTTKIIVGGPFVSTQVRTQDNPVLEYLFTNSIRADFFVNSSQGEATLVKLIHAVKNNLPVEPIENIYYKVHDKLFSTPILKEDNKLSDNSVNWNLFSKNVGAFVNVRTAISCPFSCSFCGFPEHAGDHQVLDVEGIEKELNQLDKIGTVKSINFIDDTFNVPLKRFKEILRMMIKNKYNFKWHSYFRCQYADRETVEMMKESGCEGVFLGIESGNEQILKNMNKASHLDQYLKGISLLKEYDISTFGSFIIGFPGETLETVQDTVTFIKESGIDFYRAQLWYCEPITPIWREKEKYRIKGESFEWSHATMDSKIACDLIDNIFWAVEDPIWIPQYNFDFDTIWHLVHQGISIEDIKIFLKAFSSGIKEKFPTRGQWEISNETIKQLMRFCQKTEYPDNSQNKKKELSDKYGAGFDY
jgi:anaerobic magnesium-protoporphyrin IX monomethyl ester cyclase